jgi:hypothetical protein
MHRLRLYESRVLRKMFEPKGDGVRGKLRRLYIIMKSFMISTVHHILSLPRDQEGGDVARMRESRDGFYGLK